MREAWLTVVTLVTAAGTMGAVLDVCFGKERVKDWMEGWWLQLEDVWWDNFGREEALIAVQRMDRLFGSHLFSTRRMIVVLLTTLVSASLIAAKIMFSHVVLSAWPTFFTTANFVWLIFIVFSLTSSFSITRFVSISVARLLTTAPYLSLFGLILLILFQYGLLCYWVPLIKAIHLGMWFAYEGTTTFSFRDFIGTLSYNARVITRFFTENWQIASIPFQVSAVYMVGPDDGRAPVFMYNLSVLANILPSLSRLSIMTIFFAFLFLRPLKRPIMEIWDREIIKSDRGAFKMLFALLLAASVGIVSTIYGIAKAIQWLAATLR